MHPPPYLPGVATKSSVESRGPLTNVQSACVIFEFGRSNLAAIEFIRALVPLRPVIGRRSSRQQESSILIKVLVHPLTYLFSVAAK
jgi:hypothetical protein